MISGAHVILFAEDAGQARSFFRDVLGWENVDAGGGWLIFKSPPAELAMHPVEPGHQHQELWLMCDDIHATRTELEAKGVRFTKEVSRAGFGLVTEFEVPGAGPVGLYEPKHPTATAL